MAAASRMILAVVSMGASVGCSSAGAPDDAGGPPLTGRQAFVVSSTFTAAPGGYERSRPDSQRFTISLDLDQETGPAIVGWAGGGVVATFTRTAGGFRLSAPLRIPIQAPFGSGCGDEMTYDELSFGFLHDATTSRATGGLTGEGRGTLDWVVGGDLLNEVKADASAAGLPDDEPPTLAFTATRDVTDPLLSFTVMASEPLAPDAHAALVAEDGERIELVPSSSGNFVNGFLGPTKTLRYAEQYRLAVDGVVDLGGNAALADAPFTTHAMPPLIPEDGFESSIVLGDGTAHLISSRIGPPIAGDSSLYVPPSADATDPITQLAVRLAVGPGDTVIRFSYRTVDAAYGINHAYFRVFTADGDDSVVRPPEVTEPPTAAQIGAFDHVLGPISTAEIPLPVTATTEVFLVRMLANYNFNCSPAAYPTSGILIDDLRVE